MHLDILITDILYQKVYHNKLVLLCHGSLQLEIMDVYLLFYKKVLLRFEKQKMNILPLLGKLLVKIIIIYNSLNLTYFSFKNLFYNFKYISYLFSTKRCFSTMAQISMESRWITFSISI